jgi:hypothetical protein
VSHSESSIDVDLPAPLDDDMPILVTYITSLIGVCRNVSGILFALYTSTRPKYLAKLLGNNYEQFIVAELDSNLNEWFESIPDQRMYPETFYPKQGTCSLNSIISSRFQSNGTTPGE